MSSEREQVKSTIRKLLNLASDDAAYDNEIAQAMAHAQRLMRAYNLTEGDVEGDDEPKRTKTSTTCGKRTMSTWESALAHLICDMCGAGWYQSNAVVVRDLKTQIIQRDEQGRPLRRRRIYFYGGEADVAFAVELFAEMRDTIASMAYLKWGGCYRGRGRSYADGFVDGLDDAREQADKKDAAADATSRALVVRSQELVAAKQDAAREWLATTGVELANSPRSLANHYTAAHRDGRADGRRHELRTPAARVSGDVKRLS